MTETPAAAIVPPPAATSSALHDSAVWFTQNYRFARDSGIGKLAGSINRGDADGTSRWLRGGTDPDVTWLEGADRETTARALAAMEAGYASYAATLAADPTAVAAITTAFGTFRALCAVREGPRGVTALNAEMTRRLRATTHQPGLVDGPGASPWFAGRPVLVLSNDYVLRLFNGDIGIALPGPDGDLLVHFPDATAPGGFRAVAPVRLPRHETAFAMTVHKSQGSEFDGVLVMLPEQRSRVLTRELLYTAVTRARRRATLVGDTAVMEAAIVNPTRRHSGLLTRLAEAAG